MLTSIVKRLVLGASIWQASASSSLGRKACVVSVDGGTESIRAGVFRSDGTCVCTAATEYATSFPRPGWAEQSPDEWWSALQTAVVAALAKAEAAGVVIAEDVKGLCVDTTSCTVVALDEDDCPLRPAVLWMDARAARETDIILRQGAGDRALLVNCNGEGPLSAEWMLPKALWLKTHEPETWARAKTVCEFQDYLNFKLTSRWCVGSCGTSTRWHWNALKILRRQGRRKKLVHQRSTVGAAAAAAARVDAKGIGGAGEVGEESTDDDDVAVSNKAKEGDEIDEENDGRPLSLLRAIGLSDLASKWPYTKPEDMVPVGSVVGGLSTEAASLLGLPAGLPVAQGGADAFVGVLGLGVTKPGQLALITGSSHLHLCVGAVPAADNEEDDDEHGEAGTGDPSEQIHHARGVWGAYGAAPLPSQCMAEGGQSSTGSTLRWLKGVLAAPSPSSSSWKGSPTYAQLDEEAAAVPIGCDRLMAIGEFQGSRTPITDPNSRGAFLGLSLSHTRGHLWRALLEGACLGTRAAVEALTAAGHGGGQDQVIAMAGGATRSDLWLQMHADVCGRAVVVGEDANAPLLGGAMLAATACGLYASPEDAAAHMYRPAKRIEPNPEAAASYDELYVKYVKVAAAARDISHILMDGK